jgi:hypothetical protein
MPNDNHVKDFEPEINAKGRRAIANRNLQI